ncbi:hypothetical protein ZWY2020_004862 [Hordeum vulgare]|nr:hypothetical protein ZWY2020_004862 [Hordeum vulgare]
MGKGDDVVLLAYSPYSMFVWILMLNGADLKVCSSWDEDDEEALRWVGLEKLPPRSDADGAWPCRGELKEVNADKLGAQQRIASVGDDHECFLSKFKDRVEQYAPPQLELLTSSLEFLSQVCSSWDEDDEEALRWAALEKLPTYDRARTAVLAMPGGAQGGQEQKQLPNQPNLSLFLNVSAFKLCKIRFRMYMK